MARRSDERGEIPRDPLPRLTDALPSTVETRTEWFDSHCHLEDERFADDLDAVLKHMMTHSVTRCLLAGCSMETSEKIVAMTADSAHDTEKNPTPMGRKQDSSYPTLYGAVGVHPHEARSFKMTDLDRLAGWLALPQVVALGEIGLDYYYDHSPREVQRQAFIAQLDYAYERGVPVILHIRDAHGL